MDTRKVSSSASAAAVAPSDFSLSLQVFLYLQLLDMLTTWLGFRHGLTEASPFVHWLVGYGPVFGVLMSKGLAVLLGALCIWQRRMRAITIINYWYAALALWNLALLVSR